MIIVPGKSVGSLVFGMSVYEVESLLGRPTSSRAISEFRICDYTGQLAATVYYQRGRLTSVAIEPTKETSLWAVSLYQIPLDDIQLLMSNHGHAASLVPSCHPLVRPRLDVPSAGLSFYFKHDCCEDLVVSVVENYDAASLILQGSRTRSGDGANFGGENRC